jgi:hypothetical protein
MIPPNYNYGYNGVPAGYGSRPPGVQNAQTTSFGSTNSATPTSAMASNPAVDKQESSGGHGGFFQGLLNGVKKLGSFLMQPKNWLLTGGILLACMVCPPVGIALCGLGVLTGGASIMKGLSSGNMEEVGEGVFNTGLSAVGTYTSVQALNAAKGASAAASADSAAQGAQAGNAADGSLLNNTWNVVSNGSSAETVNQFIA